MFVDRMIAAKTVTDGAKLKRTRVKILSIDCCMKK